MNSTLFDKAMYLEIENNDVIGVTGIYVDDNLITGNNLL